jgi:hypothetical protein
MRALHSASSEVIACGLGSPRTDGPHGQSFPDALDHAHLRRTRLDASPRVAH